MKSSLVSRMPWAVEVPQGSSTDGRDLARANEPVNAERSSDRRLQPIDVKEECRVIVHQHGTVNLSQHLAHTARQPWKVKGR